MGNPLSVRRVKVQTIDADGNPEGQPTFGVMAADSIAQSYNDTFGTLAELNRAVADHGSLLAVLDDCDDCFENADHEKIGCNNFYGKDWEL